MKKCLAICIYLLLITAFLQFDIRLLFDARQFFLVVFGAVLLYLPALGVKKRIFHFDRGHFGQNSLWASIIQTFVLLFMVLSEGQSREEMLLQAAMACRPLLYGFCLWVVFSEDTLNMSGKRDKLDEMQKMENTTDAAGKKLLMRIHEGTEEGEKCIDNRETETVHEQIHDETKGAEGFPDDGTEKGIDKEADRKEDAEESVTKPETEETSRERLARLGLTRREIEVALLASAGLSNAEIAAELFISETTVKKHLSNIYGKLDISRRGQIKGVLSLKAEDTINSDHFY